MISLILATAALLQAPAQSYTEGLRVRTDPIIHHAGPMGTAAGDTTARAQNGSPADTVPALPARLPSARIGPDKVQHFMMSYAIASFTYGAARAAGIDRRSSLHGAMAGTLAVGAAKELIDTRTGGDPSFGDFLADIFGAAAAYVILRQVN